MIHLLALSGLAARMSAIGARIAPSVMAVARSASKAIKAVGNEIRRNPVTTVSTVASGAYIGTDSNGHQGLGTHTGATPSIAPTYRAPKPPVKVVAQPTPVLPAPKVAPVSLAIPPEVVGNDGCVNIYYILDYVKKTPGYEDAIATVESVMAADGAMFACEGFAYLQLNGKTTRLAT